MADDLERASIADVEGESTDDKHAIDIDLGLFGAGATEAIVADLDGESLAEHDQEVDDDGAPTRVADADSGIEPIGGYRAEWRPSDGESDTFDPTDLRAGADVSYGAGATDAPLDADPPDGGSADVVPIGGDYEEPTEIWLGPAEGGDDAVTEVSDTDAPLAATYGGGDDVVTEVSDTDAPLAATDSTNFEDVD